MSFFDKLVKNSRVALVAVVVIILVVVSGSIYLMTKQSSQDSEQQAQNQETENVVVFASDAGSTSEGSTLPEDIDFDTLLPELPPTATLIKVVDNKQESFRKTILKYKVVKEKDELTDQVVESMTNIPSWTSLIQQPDGTILATRENVQVMIEIIEIEKLNQELTVVIIQY